MKKHLAWIGLLLAGMVWLSVGANSVDAASIGWKGYDEGLSLANKEGKKVMLHFWAEWCGYCKKMEKETFQDKKVIAYLNDYYIPIKVNSDIEQQLAANYFVRGLPTTWFLTKKGEKISNLPGYVPADMFLPILKFVHTDSYEKMSFKEFLDGKPN